MLKPYLFVLNDSQVTRQAILDFLDTRPEVKNWYAFMPTAIFIISDRSAAELANILRKRFAEKNFMLTEVPVGANDGWLPQKAWDFINNPKSSGRWPM